MPLIAHEGARGRSRRTHSPSAEHVESFESTRPRAARSQPGLFIRFLCHACIWDRVAGNFWKHDAIRPGTDEHRDRRRTERVHRPDLIGEPTEQRSPRPACRRRTPPRRGSSRGRACPGRRSSARSCWSTPSAPSASADTNRIGAAIQTEGANRSATSAEPEQRVAYARSRSAGRPSSCGSPGRARRTSAPHAGRAHQDAERVRAAGSVCPRRAAAATCTSRRARSSPRATAAPRARAACAARSAGRRSSRATTSLSRARGGRFATRHREQRRDHREVARRVDREAPALAERARRAPAANTGPIRRAPLTIDEFSAIAFGRSARSSIIWPGTTGAPACRTR